MTSMNAIGTGEPIFAAGGLLLRAGSEGTELAVVHRARYEEWGLPKGKPADEETLRETALREVREETGYAARITGFAGAIDYLVGDAPKVVLFWTMAPAEGSRFQPSEEVDRVEWLTPSKALDRLPHQEERGLILRWQRQESM